MEKITFSWRESITHTYEEITTQIISFAPQLIGAIALLIAGWIIAKTLGVASKKLVGSFDSLFQRVAQTDGARQEKIKRSYAVIVSKVVFWTVMIFFISAAANTLGWQMFSSWMNSIVIYLPNLITGLLIILGGFLLGNGVKSVVINAAHSAGIEQGQFLARVVQIVILFTTLVIGIEQIGINVIFLTNVLVVTVGVFLSGAALAFGLGARTLVANIIGGQYVRKHCRVGEQMRLGAVEGNLVEVTQTSIILDTESGRTVIPAKYFQEQVSSFISNRKDSSEKSAASSPKGDKDDQS
jgi:small-conductance mechanosensitive channel